MYFANLKGNDIAESFRDRLKDLVVSKLGLNVPGDYQNRYPAYQISEWENKVDILIQIFRDLLSGYELKPPLPAGPTQTRLTPA